MMYNGYALKCYVDMATRLYFNHYWTAHNIGDIFAAEFEKFQIDLLGIVDELYTNAEITIVSRCEANQPRFDIILKGDDVYKLSIDWTYAGRYGDDHIEKFVLFKNGEPLDMNEDIEWKITDALYKTATRCLVRPDEFDKRN
nr:MAG TPA: hypothetical protein [Caudoviricetes sp.]